MSVFNIAALYDGTAFGYSGLLENDGCINVHLSSTEFSTIFA
jgi:hypothetical protein